MFSAKRGFAQLLSLAKTFFVIQPPRLRHIGPGSSFRYGWVVTGAGWIQIGADCEFQHHINLAALANTPERDAHPKLLIGDGVYVGPYCFFVAMDEIRIGKGVVFSERVLVCDCAHGFDPEAGPILQQPNQPGGRVVIGDHTFVGYAACILPGVELGKHCVVAANAVVTKSFPDYTMVGGNPAKVLRRYDPKLKQWVAPDRNTSTAPF